MERACQHCGKPIVGRDKRAKFCSPRCKDRAYTALSVAATKRRRAGRECVVCDGPIEVTRSSKAFTCSNACSVKYQNGKKQAAAQERWNAKRQLCPQCREQFPPDSRSIYCSQRCKRRYLSARWREKSPGYMRQYLYGITPEEHAALLEKQDSKCAICFTDTPGGKGGFHVDHDHDSGAVRGLLCHACNVALGNFADDPERLRAALRYLGE